MKFTNVLKSHELRYGVEVEFNGYHADLSERGIDSSAGVAAGSGSYIQERQYFVQGSRTTTNTAWFVQDSWQPANPTCELNLGLRYESQRMDSANDVAISRPNRTPRPARRHAECRTVDGLNLGKQLGAAAGPRRGTPPRNGRSKVYGFWGRFYEAIPLNINIRAINGERYIIPQHVSPLNPQFERTGSAQTAAPWRTTAPGLSAAPPPLTALTPLDEDLKTQSRMSSSSVPNTSSVRHGASVRATSTGLCAASSRISGRSRTPRIRWHLPDT